MLGIIATASKQRFVHLGVLSSDVQQATDWIFGLDAQNGQLEQLRLDLVPVRDLSPNRG